MLKGTAFSILRGVSDFGIIPPQPPIQTQAQASLDAATLDALNQAMARATAHASQNNGSANANFTATAIARPLQHIDLQIDLSGRSDSPLLADLPAPAIEIPFLSDLPSNSLPCFNPPVEAPALPFQLDNPVSNALTAAKADGDTLTEVAQKILPLALIFLFLSTKRGYHVPAPQPKFIPYPVQPEPLAQNQQKV